MKLIVTGSSGTIGNAALVAALKRPDVDSVVALCRRDLPANPKTAPYASKLKVVIVKDWENWTDAELLEHMRTADGCVWAAGNMAQRQIPEDDRVKTTFGYPSAFINALPARSKPMKLVHIGGQIAVRDQNASLWFLSDLRKGLGALQNKLLDFNKTKSEAVDVYLADPGFVQKADGARQLLSYIFPYVSQDQIGNALVETALHGGEPRCLSNSDLVRKGNEVSARL